MKANRKILFIIGLMLVVITFTIMTIVAINFRHYAHQNAQEKSKIVAEIVRDGLTAHMINEIMDKRASFLQNISNSKDIESLWIVRSKNVIEQFGEGLANEFPRDDIDKKVLQSGKIYEKIFEDSQNAMIRVTIPYIATSYGNPNCLECHNAKEGDVLGAISMEFDISSIRQLGAVTIFKILGTSFIFLLLAIFITNYLIKPYISVLEDLRRVIEKAYHGDFSDRVEIKRDNEVFEVAKWLNTLIDKFHDTLGSIEHNIALFVPHSNIATEDPLEKSKIVIEELGDIYKFKKTIELDKNKLHIYNRFFYILKNKFKVKDFSFYEVNYKNDMRKLIFSTTKESLCQGEADQNCSECRAYRVDAEVVSDEFHQLCGNFNSKDKEYLCIPFKINSEIGLVISIIAEDEKELQTIYKQKPLINNYLDAMKPVVESKVLMEILRDSSLRDGLTSLYNRRFLEEFIEKATQQALRSKTGYAVLMLDIDFFKMVNDTYGHDVGDVVIKGLGKVLIDNVRQSDLAIRFGGEEFVILLHNPTEKGAIEVANKIRLEFAKHKFQAGTESIQKTLSVGVSFFPNDTDSIWKCIKYADIALYKAKETGRNKVVKFDLKMFPEGQEY